MKKIFYAFLVIAVSCSGFPNISLAQKESPANDAGQQKDIEQNMNDMIKLLEELQSNEEMSQELLLPKKETVKAEVPDPMEIFTKPEENLNPAVDLVEKNEAENMIEMANEAVTSNPVAPTRPSQQDIYSDREEMNRELLRLKKATEKAEAPDPMEIFTKPEENLKPVSEPVAITSTKNIIEKADKTVTPIPVAPLRPSQANDKILVDKKAVPSNEIEKNVNDMLKALEELQNSEQLGAVQGQDSLGNTATSTDTLNSAGDSQYNTTVGKSIEKTDEVVRLDPTGPDSHFQSGLVFWKSKNLIAAIYEFKEVIRMAPENAHAYWNLGLLYDESSRGPEAIANIKKAKDIYAKYEYLEYVEDARMRLKQFSEKYGQPLPE